MEKRPVEVKTTVAGTEPKLTTRKASDNQNCGKQSKKRRLDELDLTLEENYEENENGGTIYFFGYHVLCKLIKCRFFSDGKLHRTYVPSLFF